MRDSEQRYSYTGKPPYSEEGLLGKGSFAQVYRVRIGSQIYALKRIYNYHLKEQKYLESVQREIRIMKMLDHPNIVKLIDVYETDSSLELLLEYVPGGNLFDKIKAQDRVPEYLAKKYILDIVKVIKYLHSFEQPILHRDIKPENILLTEMNSVKLCDFGSSNVIAPNQSRDSYVGTAEYMAPEMKECKTHDQSLDLWSIGILMFELLTGEIPKFEDNLSIVFPDYLSICAQDLMKRILVRDGNKRISLEDIEGHMWFVGEKLPPHIKDLGICVKRHSKEEMIERMNLRNEGIKNKLKKLKNNENSQSVNHDDDHHRKFNEDLLITKKVQKEAEEYMERVRKIALLQNNIKEKKKKIEKEKEQVKNLELIEKELNKLVEERTLALQSNIETLSNTLPLENSKESLESVERLIKDLENLKEYSLALPERTSEKVLQVEEFSPEPSYLPISDYLPKIKLKMLEEKRNALVSLKFIKKRRMLMDNMLHFENHLKKEEKKEETVNQNDQSHCRINSENFLVTDDN